MTTSFATLCFQDGTAMDFDGTDSNDAWANMLSRTGTDASSLGNENLGDAVPGKTLGAVFAETTVGCCMWRIRRNGVTIRAGVGVNVVAVQDPQGKWGPCKPLRILTGDKLEIFTVATPT